MTILAIDPCVEDLKALKTSLRQAYPHETVRTYGDPMLAFKYLFHNPVGAVFTAVDMNRVDGFLLAKMIRHTRRNVQICFVHRDSSYLEDAQDLPIDGYLVKPLTPVSVQQLEQRLGKLH